MFLPCLSTGSQQPIFRWEKDGRNVILPHGSENGELLIQSANETTDSGKYDCIAENYLGSVTHQFFVAVEGICSYRYIQSKITFSFCSSS